MTRGADARTTVLPPRDRGAWGPTFPISATLATSGEFPPTVVASRSEGLGLGPVRYCLCNPSGMEGKMLYTIAVLLLIAWLLGMVGTYTVGSFIHVLLVVAVVLFLVGLISGRRTIP